MQKKILDILLNADDFISGQEISENLGVSRQAVWKSINALKEKGYEILSAEAAYIPSTTSDLSDEDTVAKMEKLLDMLDENDDVQNVWHNWNMPEQSDE